MKIIQIIDHNDSRALHIVKNDQVLRRVYFRFMASGVVHAAWPNDEGGWHQSSADSVTRCLKGMRIGDVVLGDHGNPDGLPTLDQAAEQHGWLVLRGW